MRNELEVHHISVSRKMKNISSPLLASLCKYILGWCLYMEQKYVLNSMMAMNSQINIFYLTYSSSVANLIGRFTYPFLGRSLLVDLIFSTQKIQYSSPTDVMYFYGAFIVCFIGYAQTR